MTSKKPSQEANDVPSGVDAPEEHPTHEEIAIRAYEIYEASGRPEGCDGDHWLEAERELTEKYAAGAQRAKAKSA